ncbi:L-rhamnose-binding lectin CSL1-like [Dunckerocampus dactyliophorus]|uniref:L-rhamnose-binding lectin CSL1-like n=1 Tax=Dunckerocampus dactyliophorus TaxID=161453 RepID=UPI002406AA7E|nr:L-rhamnose-binding lectin CSL1-like [Dunckerocampus dactyliophorus]XP_054627552.1 L-rhamnose-binding lectin CSL1-like [Dunckerocampus dactyliophorus]
MSPIFTQARTMDSDLVVLILIPSASLSAANRSKSGVISVQEGLYGRTDAEICKEGRPPQQLANTACSQAGAVDVLKSSCNGRNRCNIRASNGVFGDPCFGTYKYLKVLYTCEKSGMISVQEGLYGRTDPEICNEGRPPQQLANTECSQEGALDVLKSRCNGKKTCELNVDVFRTSDPCVGIFKYLETNFTCLPPNTFHVLACEDSLAHLSCDEWKVISVRKAIYGRLDQTTCIFERPPSQVQNDECKSKVTSVVANSCNGKNSCTIRVSNGAFGDPCGGTYKYLKVFYKCNCGVPERLLLLGLARVRSVALVLPRPPLPLEGVRGPPWALLLGCHVVSSGALARPTDKATV